jgi:protein-S-isoprenylcysteine O-methyltransferase Ste14
MNRSLLTPRVILQMLLFVVLVPFLPLLISGQWDWWEAWVYALLMIGSFVLSRVLAAQRHPDLLAERARFMQHADAKAFDRVLAPVIGLGSASILIVAGLDARLGWSSGFSATVEIVALCSIVAGLALGTYALMENRFFSGMVRIQFDRGHEVVTGGPYRWVRHPGYLGALLVYLATPFFLDSLWALLPALAFSAALVLRTALEDETLQQELPGYRDYASQKTRYRLLPGLW